MQQHTLSEQESLFFKDMYHFMKTSHPEMLSTFGIWRIHQHFEVGEGEVLHETSDAVHRESTVRVIKESDLPSGAFAASWTLSEKGPVVAQWCCDFDRIEVK